MRLASVVYIVRRLERMPKQFDQIIFACGCRAGRRHDGFFFIEAADTASTRAVGLGQAGSRARLWNTQTVKLGLEVVFFTRRRRSSTRLKRPDP